MGAGMVRAADLDQYVAACDQLGGLDTPATQAYLADFQYVPTVRVDESLDPFSEAYFEQQHALYREIAGRELNQLEGERSPIDPANHLMGANPYHSSDIRFIAPHARTIQTCLMLADLPPAAHILDLGCGWGLSSEMMAFAGAQVTAVDINAPFVEIVRSRAQRLGLPIEAHQSDYDFYQDGRQYDLIFFYETLHHSLRPWVTLGRLGQFLKRGGKIVFAGETINTNWWKHWGLRLDSFSVYCFRKYGWWESGWSADFLTACFARADFALTLIDEIGLRNTEIGFAVRSVDASQVRPNLSMLPRSQADLAAARAEINQLNQLHAEMQKALSWRLAEPVRAVGRFFRRIKRR